MEAAVVSGIGYSRDEAKFTLRTVPDTPGIAYAILGPIAEANIDVDMILQNLSAEGMTDFSFTVSRKDGARTNETIKKEVQTAIGDGALSYDDKACNVTIVSIGMRSHAVVVSTRLETFAEEGLTRQ